RVCNRRERVLAFLARLQYHDPERGMRFQKRRKSVDIYIARAPGAVLEGQCPVLRRARGTPADEMHDAEAPFVQSSLKSAFRGWLQALELERAACNERLGALSDVLPGAPGIPTYVTRRGRGAHQHVS